MRSHRYRLLAAGIAGLIGPTLAFYVASSNAPNREIFWAISVSAIDCFLWFATLTWSTYVEGVRGLPAISSLLMILAGAFASVTAGCTLITQCFP
jgi:hypothetical protein